MIKTIDRGPTPDADLPLTMGPAECPLSCSKCDEAWEIATAPRPDGYGMHVGYIRAGNCWDTNRGLAAAVVFRMNNFDHLCDRLDRAEETLRLIAAQGAEAMAELVVDSNETLLGRMLRQRHPEMFEDGS